MTPTLAQILSAVATTISIDGVTLRPEESASIKPIFNMTPVKTSAVGTLKNITQETGFEISFKPDGRFTNGICDVLHPYRSLAYGRPTGAVLFIAQATGINTGTDVITYVGHGLATGDAVAIGYTRTAPTITGGFPRGTLVYARAINANTFTLHDTAAHAEANSDKYNFTALGVGWLTVARMRKVVVYTNLGFKITFHHCCVTQLPNLRVGAVNSLWEAVTLRAFHKMGTAPGANSLYTIEEISGEDFAITESEYMFGTPTVSTDGGAAFADLPVGAVVEIDFTLTAEDMPNDAQGMMGQRFDNVGATVKVMCPGYTVDETLDFLGMESARGADVEERSISVATAGGFRFAMNGVLRPPEITAAAKADLVGALTFELVRTHTDGLPDAAYSLFLD